MAFDVNNTSCIKCKHTYMKGVFTDSDFIQLECNRSDMTFSTGDMIIKQGLFVSQIFYIRTGIVKLVIEGENDKGTIIQIIEENDFVALPVLGNPKTYPFSAIALTNCQVCVIRNETITDIMKNNEKANDFLLKNYHADYIHLCNRINTLSTRNNHGKLATAILYLSGDHFNQSILNIVSRKDLAQLAAISLESCNKILTELKKDKIIDIINNQIKVLKPDSIKKLSNIG